ncbi:hypothetical protein ACFWPU_01215 [Streptomyces sp. NPDC058471]|uniref:hypothetical protein n=1 Tax=Streptomyces sp. NPDC058471 TaxID=3346516 RepID=UPI00365304B1
MAKWSVCLTATVSKWVEVEADNQMEAWKKAEAAVKKEKLPTPKKWTPVMTSRK